MSMQVASPPAGKRLGHRRWHLGHDAFDGPGRRGKPGGSLLGAVSDY
ncbi:MAG: hypothetical protein HQ567_00385 [Candidatus Nealsonbacteria bacterium]|nr:hypothetical protein [Candidatus Nealsonbacteria bacterium]